MPHWTSAGLSRASSTPYGSCTARSPDGVVRYASASKPREVTSCATRISRARALKIWLWCCSTRPCSRMSSSKRTARSVTRRRIASLLYNLECRALFDLSYWDVNGTPKVFPRSLEKLMQLSRDDDLIDIEFNVICRREGYRMLEVPIFSNRRHGGRSTTGYFSAAKLYWGAVRFWRSIRNGDS